MSFLWIPVEILVGVFESLDDWKDLLRCMEVSIPLEGLANENVRPRLLILLICLVGL